MSAPDDRMGTVFTVIAGAVVAVLGVGAVALLWWVGRLVRGWL